MSAFATAQEIIRAASDAGLAKEVVFFLEKKSEQLAEQVGKLERENAQLKAEVELLREQLQRAQPVGLVENEGVLWKRTATGFEKNPYCKQCTSHPVMLGKGSVWLCGSGEHFAPRNARPPAE